MKYVFELTCASMRRMYKGRRFLFRHEKGREKETKLIRINKCVHKTSGEK